MHAEPTARFPVEQATLANGLRVVVQPDRTAPLVALSMCYDAGSRHDPAGRWGMAHLCEHLAFRGPRNRGRPGYAERLHRAGGLAQASTSADQVSFTTLLPSRKLGVALEVEAARLREASAWRDAAELEREGRILVAELSERSSRRVLSGVLEQVNALLYPPGHPYHRAPAGDPGSIRAITWGEVAGFLAARYAPPNAVLVLVGRFDTAAIIERARRLFEGLPTASGAAASAPPPVRPPRGERRRVAAGAAAETEVHLAWIVAGLGHDEWRAAALLMRGLAVGRSSPLAQELVDRRGLAREVRAHLVAMRDASSLVLGARAATRVTPRHLEEGLTDALDQLLARGISEPLLARARKKALTDHYHAVQRLDRRADLCARTTALLGMPDSLSAEPGRYLNTPRKAVNRLGARLREDGAGAVLCIEPRGEGA